MTTRERKPGDEHPVDEHRVEPQSRRERATEETRNAILDAFLSLAHTSNAVTVSIPAVAERAGVSTRTVYRYFPSKNELQNAAAYRYPDIALGSAQAINDTTMGNFEETMAALWNVFAERLPAVHGEHATPAGRELRAARLGDSRARVATSAKGQLSDDAIDMIVAVTSSSMFLELVDRMGHTPEHAASLAYRMVMLLLVDELPQLRDRFERSES